MSARIGVLLVDDELPARRRLLQLLCDEADVDVVGEAVNGHEAVSMIEELRPCLVFLDMQMPELDGLSATSQFRAQGRRDAGDESLAGAALLVQAAGDAPVVLRLAAAEG